MPQIQKRTIALKSNPQTDSFARIKLIFKKFDYTIDKNEFKFIIASAVQTVHGDIANEPQLLQLESIDQSNYRAIIKFKTIHHARIVSSLLLFGKWKGADCRFELDRVAQSPCFLAT